MEEHKPREEGRSVSKKRGPIDRGWKEEEEEHSRVRKEWGTID